MKKLLSFALALFCLLNFSGCGKNTDDSDCSDDSRIRGTFSDESTTGNSDTTSSVSLEFESETEILAESFYSDENVKKPSSVKTDNSPSPSQNSKPVVTSGYSETEKSASDLQNEDEEKRYIPSNSDLNKIASNVLNLINSERTESGLDKLSVNSFLNEKSTARSKELITKFAHTRPNGKSFESILKDDGFSFDTCGESLAKVVFAQAFTGSDAQIKEIANKIFKSFTDNYGYYQNILNFGFTETGIGISYIIGDENIITFYVTQLYIG